jgi:hypothetical protein
MKSRIVVLLVCLVGALLTYAYSAEIAAGATTAATTQNHVDAAPASLPGWTETGYALYAD